MVPARCSENTSFQNATRGSVTLFQRIKIPSPTQQMTRRSSEEWKVTSCRSSARAMPLAASRSPSTLRIPAQLSGITTGRLSTNPLSFSSVTGAHRVAFRSLSRSP